MYTYDRSAFLYRLPSDVKKFHSRYENTFPGQYVHTEKRLKLILSVLGQKFYVYIKMIFMVENGLQNVAS